MKKLVLLIAALSMTGSANAINRGLICITYLSKDGTLEIHEGNMFDTSDLQQILEYIRDQFNVDLPETRDLEPAPFARGLATDRSLYPRTVLLRERLYFQNGIFYYERSQDTAIGMMEQFSQVVGGTPSVLCVSIEDAD